jgi:hypothetical protein
MGKWLSFTNITLALFVIYLTTTIKSFYEMFYPDECAAEPKRSSCLYSIPNWQREFSVKIKISTFQFYFIFKLIMFFFYIERCLSVFRVVNKSHLQLLNVLNFSAYLSLI